METELRSFCYEAIEENKEAVKDYKEGAEIALTFLMASVIRKMNASTTQQDIKDALKKVIKEQGEC